jgi:hypothetical protein
VLQDQEDNVAPAHLGRTVIDEHCIDQVSDQAPVVGLVLEPFRREALAVDIGWRGLDNEERRFSVVPSYPITVLRWLGDNRSRADGTPWCAAHGAARVRSGTPVWPVMHRDAPNPD